MNCKPGDTAILVKIFNYGRAEKFLGCVVQVSHIYGDRYPYGPMWALKEPVYVGSDYITGAADACLKPIRDPGDDAKDEMLRPLPKPVEVLS